MEESDSWKRVWAEFVSNHQTGEDRPPLRRVSGKAYSRKASSRRGSKVRRSDRKSTRGTTVDLRSKK